MITRFIGRCGEEILRFAQDDSLGLATPLGLDPSFLQTLGQDGMEQEIQGDSGQQGRDRRREAPAFEQRQHQHQYGPAYERL